MPTTPNYGWDTPADTDYVTNGALSIRTLGNDADATVKANQDATNAAIATKFDIAGGSFTGPIAVPHNTAQGFAIAIAQNSAGNGVLRFIAVDGSTQTGYIQIVSDDSMTFYIAQSGNSLTFNNVGETTRTHDGETRPLPFAMEMGRTTVSANSSVTVTLNSGRFTRVPLILITPERNTALAGVDFHSGNRTTSNFKIYNNDNESWVFNWQAIQMTATDSEG